MNDSPERQETHVGYKHCKAEKYDFIHVPIWYDHTILKKAQVSALRKYQSKRSNKEVRKKPSVSSGG